MNFQQEKFVRFQDWTAEKNVEPLYSPDDDLPPGKFRRTINSVSVKFQRSLESGSERIKTSWKSYLIDSVVGNSFGSGILNPQGPFLQKWNKIFVLACIIAVSLDPLFSFGMQMGRDEMERDKTARDGTKREQRCLRMETRRKKKETKRL